MKKYICLLLLLIAGKINAQHPSPRQLYPGLFEQVQISQIFTDSKTFVDAIPRENPQLIEQEYLKHKSNADFNLKAFVTAHFIPYSATSKPYHSNIQAGVRQHIDTLWSVLSRNSDADTKSSLIPLPHPYIVPGGRFREVYYWDSYFTMLGLQQAGKVQTINNIIENFAYLIQQLGFIPNGNRTYYATRSQPPFFNMMVELLAKDKGNTTLVKYLPAMLAEYYFWMKGAMGLKPGQAINHSIKLADGMVLNRYWDSSDQPREESYREDVLSAKATKQKQGDFYRNIRAAAESGWDFSSRWFSDGQHLTTIKTTDIVPVDLNALMYHMELTIAKAYGIKGVKDSVLIFKSRAVIRKQAILKYCWSSGQDWFMDYNFRDKKQTNIKSLAGTVPLFFGIANRQQAIKVAKVVQNQFLKPGGLVTTLNKTGQQWDWPNAWAPLQYMAIEGLENYHQHALAQTIAKRWIAINTSVFNQTGKLMEKYDVTDTRTKAGGGEYPLQDGFGWTNGVLLKLMSF
jgi:alpha,alpha-trehalase